MELAIADAAAIHVLLAAASADIDSRHGRQMSNESVIHHSTALRKTNQRLVQSWPAPSDGTIIAVALLAGYELLFGLPMTFNTHMDGLALMLGLRGGLQSFQASNL